MQPPAHQHRLYHILFACCCVLCSAPGTLRCTSCVFSSARAAALRDWCGCWSRLASAAFSCRRVWKHTMWGAMSSQGLPASSPAACDEAQPGCLWSFGKQLPCDWAVLGSACLHSQHCVQSLDVDLYCMCTRLVLIAYVWLLYVPAACWGWHLVQHLNLI